MHSAATWTYEKAHEVNAEYTLDKDSSVDPISGRGHSIMMEPMTKIYSQAENADIAIERTVRWKDEEANDI